MGLLKWLDPEIDNDLGNIVGGVLRTGSIGGGIMRGIDQNREDDLIRQHIPQLKEKIAPQFRDMVDADPRKAIMAHTQFMQQRQASKEPWRGVAMRAVSDPKIYGALKAKADAEGWGQEIDTPEKLQMFAYQGMKPEDAAPQKSQLGMTGYWGVDAQGNPVLLQLGQGQAVQAQLPQGVRLTPGVGMLNTGTSFMPYNQKTGAPAAAPIPIDVAGKVMAEEAAKTVSENVANAPKSIQAGEQMLSSIGSVLRDKNFDYGTGALGMISRNIPGTGTYDFGAKTAQLKGKAFLQAFNDLRGGGQITQIEGEKATNAIARLDEAQSAEAYRAALEELQGIVSTVLDRQRRILQQGYRQSSPQPTAGAPARPSAPVANDPLGIR